MPETIANRKTGSQPMIDITELPAPMDGLIDRIKKLSVEIHQAAIDTAVLRHSKYADDLNRDKLDAAIAQLEKAMDSLDNAAIELMATRYQSLRNNGSVIDSN